MTPRGPHRSNGETPYARICALWSNNVESNGAALQKLAGAKRLRIWRVPLAGGSYAFEQDWTSLYQIVCGKAGARANTLPWPRQRRPPAVVKMRASAAADVSPRA